VAGLRGNLPTRKSNEISKKVKAANEAITTFEQYKKAVNDVADSAFAAHEQMELLRESAYHRKYGGDLLETILGLKQIRWSNIVNEVDEYLEVTRQESLKKEID